MASWMKTFGERKDFGSGIVFLEMQLRQALAATSSSGDPDAFRTACVCECLQRLPEVAGPSAAVLTLLRQELMRAVYLDYQPFGKGRHAIDAQALLARKTYFTECVELRMRVKALEERLTDWIATKDALAQDSDGRNELLRLAANRWNTVLLTIRESAGGGGAADALQETSRKLNALLDSMWQHSRAIDELQRVALLEPVERMHAQVASMGGGARRRFILELLREHGGLTLANEAEAERNSLVHVLLMGLALPERQTLLRSLASHEGLVGKVAPMMSSVLDSLRPHESAEVLKEQLGRYSARMGAEPEEFSRIMGELVDAALAAVPGAAAARREKGTQSGGGLGRAAEAAVQTRSALAGHAARAELLADVAAEVGAEATAALPSALEEMVVTEREARSRGASRGGSRGNTPATPTRGGGRTSPREEREEPEHRALMPLLRALDRRCAEQRQVELQLRAEIARLRGFDGLGEEKEPTA